MRETGSDATPENSIDSTITLLRSELRRSQATPGVADGTIVRFGIDQYTYAALFVDGSWWLTGKSNHHLPSKVYTSTSEFTDEVLSRAHSIEVATRYQGI